MSRPRMAAIVSAVVASALAFVVVSRWGLAGTLTGAAIVPLVYTLVSHWAAEALDHVGRWIHRRVFRRRDVDGRDLDRRGADGAFQPDESPASSLVDAVAGPESDLPVRETGAGRHRSSKWGNLRTQWSLVGFACLALAISVYSLVSSDVIEKTIVRETVVEKTVTVTVPSSGTSVAQASTVGPSTTTTVSGQGNAAATTSTTVPATTSTTVPVTTTSTEDNTDAQSAPVGARPSPIDQEEEPASTTVTEPSTDTCLP